MIKQRNKPLSATFSYSWYIDILGIILGLGCLFFLLLGVRTLFVPDEGRYAEIAREMVASGDYITPHLNGIKYFEKPALFYWLEAASIHLAGLSLWSLRSVNALLSILNCLTLYITTRILYNRTTGLLAAFILGTSTLYFVMTQMLSLDLPVTVFISITLYMFLIAILPNYAHAKRYLLWIAAASAACAVLTKGLIGLLFPGLIIASWLTFTQNWRLLPNLHIVSCLIIFLLLALPWHILVSVRNPEFAYFYFIQQHFLRYATKDIGHYQPVWFFIPVLVLGFFPWIVFLPQTIINTCTLIYKNVQQHQKELFLLLWALIIFVFFSFSNSKLIPYILPMFPPLAILTAQYLSRFYDATFRMNHTKAPMSLNLSYVSLTLTAGLLTIMFSYYTTHYALPQQKPAHFGLLTTASLLLIGTLISLIYLRRDRIATAITCTLVTTSLFLLSGLAQIPFIETRTIWPLAVQLNSILKPNDEVITFNQYYQDLPFYLQRRVTILGWRNELRYGMKHQDASTWMIDTPTFWAKWRSSNRIFVIISKSEYLRFLKEFSKPPHAIIVEQTINTILLTNHYRDKITQDPLFKD